MFKPKKMRKLRLIVLKSHIENLIKDLHVAGLVDIRKVKYEGLDEGRPLHSFDAVSAELLRLRTVLSIMESAIGKKDQAEPMPIDGTSALAEAKALGVDSKLRQLNQEASEIGERMRSLEAEALVVEKVLHFKNIDFSKLNTRTLGYRVGEISLGKISRFTENIQKVDDNAAVIAEKDKNVVLILFSKKNQQKIDEVVTDAGFNDVELPENISTPVVAIDQINKENDSKKARLKEVRREILEISKTNIQRIKTLIYSLEIEADRAEIATKFSSSKCVYVIEGWMLDEQKNNLEKILQKYPDIIVDEVEFNHHETPPTVLDNPKVAEPLEFITKSYSLPNYFELDPTLAYFIGLPILYGMIVGDVLYGVASIAIGYWLMQKFKKSYIMSNVSKIWFISGFVTIIFGIIFDEWAGLTHVKLLQFIGSWIGVTLISNPIYTGFHRLSGVFELVIITVAVGIIHLGLGFILGAINEWNHSKKHALAKIAWLGVEAGIVLSIIGAIGVVGSQFMIAGLILLVTSIIGLAITEGFIGIIELPGLIGNILSYTRIAAVGIVGVVIAELLNSFLIPTPQQGLFAIILFPIFIGLHIVNAFIAMFESIVQGGRLNIVEFRSKFLHGGGEVFSPFKMR